MTQRLIGVVMRLFGCYEQPKVLAEGEIKTSQRGFTATTHRPGTQWLGLDETNYDEKTLLQRYDRAFNTLSRCGARLREGTGVDSKVDFACFYALEKDVFTDKSTQVATVALVAALLITMVLPTALSPQAMPLCSTADDAILEGCATDVLFSVYMVMLLLSTWAFTLCILCVILMVRVLTRGYTDMDTLVLWMNYGRPLEGLSNVFMYVGVIAIWVQLVVGYFLSYPTNELGVPYFALALLIVIVVLVLTFEIKVGQAGYEAQDVRCRAFAEAFCNDDGQLKEEFRKIAWAEEEAKKVVVVDKVST
jgi:hypothetical protein